MNTERVLLDVIPAEAVNRVETARRKQRPPASLLQLILANKTVFLQFTRKYLIHGMRGQKLCIVREIHRLITSEHGGDYGIARRRSCNQSRSRRFRQFFDCRKRRTHLNQGSYILNELASEIHIDAAEVVEHAKTSVIGHESILLHLKGFASPPARIDVEIRLVTTKNLKIGGVAFPRCEGFLSMHGKFAIAKPAIMNDFRHFAGTVGYFNRHACPTTPQ